MVLVYLKNLIFPQHRWTPVNQSPPPNFGDLETGLPLSPLIKSETSLDYGPHSSSSSISGDTIFEPPPPQSLHRFVIDPRVIADATIGLSDGLTVPFALTAGLSALGDTRVVIFGGLAEICAGAISMGIGGFLAAKGEADAYNTTVSSTRRLVQASPSAASALAVATLAPYLPYQTLSPHSHDEFSETLQSHLCKHPDLLTTFLLRFHHSVQAPSGFRSPYSSALTIAFGYFLGGFLPLVPYFFAQSIGTAFWWSVVVMVIALFTFGAGKTGILGEDEGFELPEAIAQEAVEEVAAEWKPAPGRKGSVTAVKPRSSLGWKCVKGGVQMVILGGVAAAAAVALVRMFSS